MNTASATTDYVLGSSDQEHDRLIRQAKTLAPYTERLFRDAGIGPGQHVLDVGSGVGDVALLASGLVGETGRVVGVDRDANALAKARARAARAANVRFIETDLSPQQREAVFSRLPPEYATRFRGPILPTETIPVHMMNVFTEEAAREEPRESIMHLLRYIGERLAASATASGARQIENRAERGQKNLTIDYEEVLRERMIVGTPGRVIDRLQEVREELGLDGILAELNPGSLIPHAQVMRALELLCKEVMPQFK